MKISLIILVLILFVLADKFLTVININAVNKNFPEAMKDDKYKAEKNPIARYLFHKTGLIMGSIIMCFISLIQIAIAYWLLNKYFNSNIALYFIFMIYGLVVTNNFYFFLKYSKIL